MNKGFYTWLIGAFVFAGIMQCFLLPHNLGAAIILQGGYFCTMPLLFIKEMLEGLI